MKKIIFKISKRGTKHIQTCFSKRTHHASLRLGERGVFFIFIFFENIFYRNIFSIFQFTVCTPTALQGGGRGPAARQEGGRDLYVNKKIYLRGRPWREPAAPLPGGRGPAARQGGGRLPPQI